MSIMLTKQLKKILCRLPFLVPVLRWFSYYSWCFTCDLFLLNYVHIDWCCDDMFRSLNYCRIFTELAESMLEKIVSGCMSGKPHFALGILDLVLICVGHHDYEVSIIFMYKLMSSNHVWCRTCILKYSYGLVEKAYCFVSVL